MLEDMNYRDPVTAALQSDYARKCFFGDMAFKDIPKQFQDSVAKELKENGLGYLYSDKFDDTQDT
jgi:hypothetical protein